MARETIWPIEYVLLAPPLAVILVALIVFWPITRRVSSESKYSSSLETISLSETSLSSLGEAEVGYNHIGGLPNQTLNRVIYAGRTFGRVVLIRRANSGRRLTHLCSPDSPWIAASRFLKV